MSKVFEIHLRSGQVFVLSGVITVVFYNDYIFFVTDDSDAFDYPVDEVDSFSCVIHFSED